MTHQTHTASLSLRPVLLLLALVCSFITHSQFITTFGGNGNNGTTWAEDGTKAYCNGIPYPKGIFVGSDYLYLVVSNAVRKIKMSDGQIHTVAGSDTYGHTGDGGQALTATLQSPYDVCSDANNNLYITEWGGHYIRRIDGATGVITTVAGTGTGGYSGDGGPAVSAMINRPQGIYCDFAGNVYFADTYNSRIRKIDKATGIITTVAGTGATSHSGDGGPAVNAGVPYPVDLCFDVAGNLYFIEVFSGNTSRVRKITKNTGIISTVAGTSAYAHSGDGGPATTASLFDPSGVFADASGNIYISQYDDSRIRKIDAATGIINTIAGTGTNSFSGDGDPAINATLNHPMGLGTDAAGDIYIADNTNHRIRKISTYRIPPPPVNAFLTIWLMTQTGVCPGNPLTFGAQLLLHNVDANTYGGAQLQWKVNGVIVYTVSSFASPTFITPSLQQGDVVTLHVYYKICNNQYSVVSNEITMNYVGGSPPFIQVEASKNPICIGDNPTFTAITQNAGSSPTYQWQLNGVNAGTNSSSFAPSGIVPGDRISCILTALPEGCMVGGTVPSNIITIEQAGNVPPSVTITASANDICSGENITFTASAQNAGLSPVYQWKVNGQPVGSNAPSYTSSSLSNNDEVLCEITAPATLCANNTAVSDPVVMQIREVAIVTLSPLDTMVTWNSQLQLHATVTPAGSSFQWTPSGILTNPASLNPLTIPLQEDVELLLSALSPDGCPASQKTTIKVGIPLYMPTAFTPNNDGLNDVFRIPPRTYLKLKDFSVYNRWGNKVFQTTDVSRGWDGKLKGVLQDSGVYVYIISGTDFKGPVFVKGSFVLIK